MSVFIIGDIHGDINSHLLYDKRYNKDDYVIIAGDAGLMFMHSYPQERIKEFRRLKYLSLHAKCTVCFIDGNHENFDYLNSLPIKEWNGGKVSFLKDNIIHLKRGQVFSLEGNTFFTMGGAESIDKHLRREGLSWWRDELPNYQEMNEGIENLQKYNNKIDYIISHDIPTEYKQELQSRRVISSVMSNCIDQYLQEIIDTVSFKHLYAGHYHVDLCMDKVSILYNTIKQIGE